MVVAKRERATLMIALDLRVPFEALLLNRLAAVPRERRQAWLRELLVDGFRQHCAGLRALQQGDQRRNFGVMAGAHASRRSLRPVQFAAAAQLKPFAALRHVIG